MTMNANAKIARAAYINGNTSLIFALVMEGIKIPVRMITEVPANELNEPPSWISWLPLLPDIFGAAFKEKVRLVVQNLSPSCVGA